MDKKMEEKLKKIGYMMAQNTIIEEALKQYADDKDFLLKLNNLIKTYKKGAK